MGIITFDFTSKVSFFAWIEEEKNDNDCYRDYYHAYGL